MAVLLCWLDFGGLLADCFYPMKKNWPAIGEEIKNGRKYWVVDARSTFKGKRTGDRRYFELKKEAEGWAQERRIAQVNAPTISIEALHEYGWTINDAIRFALEHLRNQEKSVSVQEAMEQLIASKKGAGRSERYCRDLRLRLSRLATVTVGKTMREIGTVHLDAFLVGLNLRAGTRNTFRRDIKTLWSFAGKHGWADSDVAKNTEMAKEVEAMEGANPPAVFMPEQAAALLAESKGNDLLAFHAIGLFAGLRVKELKRLDWRFVDFARGHIEISKNISKTRQRRMVPMQPNLRAWLQPTAKAAGLIIEGDPRYRRRAAQKRAGIGTVEAHIMRHSFVSYRLADIQDSARVALEAGHDPSTLFAHYLNLVTSEDAKRYFGILPSVSAAEKIVSMPAA